jgi:SAM-dependent methyltransferase
MLVAARRAEPRLLLLIADAHRLPLRDEAVHRVTCVTALHLFAEPLRALREAVRVTRRGGRVVFTTWAAGGWSSGRRLREAAAAQGLACHDPNERTGTPEAARALAIAAGLADVQVAHCRHTEPLAESEGVWERLLATAQARPVRAAPPQVQQRVREAVEQDLASEEHVVLLVTGTPQTSMPRR